MKFRSEGKLIVAMDNMKGGVEEVNVTREMLDSAMERLQATSCSSSVASVQSLSCSDKKENS